VPKEKVISKNEVGTADQSRSGRASGEQEDSHSTLLSDLASSCPCSYEVRLLSRPVDIDYQGGAAKALINSQIGKRSYQKPSLTVWTLVSW
jgi:hypothetical protein